MIEPLPELIVKPEEENDVVVLHLCGELDIATAPVLIQELHSLLAHDTRHVAIDVLELSYIDSTGVNLISTAAVSFGLAKRRLCLLKRHGIVQRIFELARLADEIPSFHALSDARDYLRRPVIRKRRATRPRTLAG